MGSESIYAKIEESRRELLDLGLRNPLLNYRPLRTRGVDMVGESTAQVFCTLVTEGRGMSFRPGKDDAGPGLFLDPGAGIAVNQTDRSLQTAESPEALQKRLLTTFRLANSSIEEKGVNTLFIALGMLRWYESDASEQERFAPVILVPVRLERAGVREQFRVMYNGEDLGVNLSFIEKARTDFVLTLPGQDALDPNEAQDIDPAGYIAQMAEVIKKKTPSRWGVEVDRIALGFFSFNKLLMYLDLGNPGIAENETIAALFGDGFREPPPGIPDDARLDNHLAPQDTYHVLDADSSQALAIHDALGGRNLVIQGPPGTGKSQTITNIIAEAIGRDKRVLFVSEKMAALEVVKRRLDNIGLGDACLELHSHKTNKREVLAKLGRVLALQEQPTNGDADSGLKDLARSRDQVNEYADAVNTPVGDSGVTPFDAFGALLSLGREVNPLPRKQLAGIGDWTAADYARSRETVEELQSRLLRCGQPRRHPFWGSRLRRVLLPGEQEELRRKHKVTVDSLETLASAVSLPGASDLEVPDSLSGATALLDAARHTAAAPDLSGLDLDAHQWESQPGPILKLLEQGACWRDLRRAYGSRLLPQAWYANLGQARIALNTDGRRFLGRLFSSAFKQAEREFASVVNGPLPKGIDAQIALIDTIDREQRLRSEINRAHSETGVVLGRCWQGLDTDWDNLTPAVRWWLDTLKASAEGRCPSDAVQLVRTSAARADGESWRAGPLQQGIAALEQAVEGYYTSVQELQSALDMDCESRFGDPVGLAALNFLEQRRTLGEWDANFADLDDLIGFNTGAAEARERGLAAVVAVAEQHSEAAAFLTNWFERAWYESIVETALGQRPALRDFDGQVHESRIERFQALDRQSLIHNRSRVDQAHREKTARIKELPTQLVRPTNTQAPDYEERMYTRQRQEQLRFLQREITKKSRHRPIRKLMGEAGGVIQDLKPVFMMSPLSIANYLAPGAVEFDLVVFDEASQVRPVDSLGALARGKKAVVVGDSRQLPPTSFFERVAQGDDAADDDESVTADIESVLGLFASQGAPSRELRWHYRSRHESLIAVSNREFYNNNLVVFPSPDGGRETLGLQYHHLPDAVYDRGRSRTNPKEAEAVALAVLEHAARYPELSLGVAALSQAQAQAIEDRLETLRRQDDSSEEFFAAHTEEPFFVKNLENVQGDERDVIFISVGYGRDERGQVFQNFGPLNRDGGERRLNVLITRAKRQCHVFTNLHAEDIASGAGGMSALRTFLGYAETGIMPDNPHISNFEVDSPFQRAVAARLKERGYLVDEEVASGGKFIDIGIRDPQHPGRYIIGIECDGASYHSARSARDRDRLREEVLSYLGWKLHRIWSTDWFRNPERELARAVEAIEQARSSR